MEASAQPLGEACDVARVLPDQTFTDVVIPSADGSRLYHFTAEGKHLRTLNALTGAVLYQFSYDSQGVLAAVTDAEEWRRVESAA